MNNNIHYKLLDEAIYPFPNFNGATVITVQPISAHTLLAMWLSFYVEIKI